MLRVCLKSIIIKNGIGKGFIGIWLRKINTNVIIINVLEGNCQRKCVSVIKVKVVKGGVDGHVQGK